MAVKTSVYLPDQLKRRLERAAAQRGRSEADLIRDALDAALPAAPELAPRWGVIPPDGTTRDDANRVDELLAQTGFGAC